MKWKNGREEIKKYRIFLSSWAILEVVLGKSVLSWYHKTRGKAGPRGKVWCHRSSVVSQWASNVHFINNCVQNYSTYILRNNQLFCGPQGLLGPKSCSSVTILRARLGAATGERGQGIRGRGYQAWPSQEALCLATSSLTTGPSGWLPFFGIWNRVASGLESLK